MDKGVTCVLPSAIESAGVRDDEDDEDDDDDGSSCSESDSVGGERRMEGARGRSLEHVRGLRYESVGKNVMLKGCPMVMEGRRKEEEDTVDLKGCHTSHVTRHTSHVTRHTSHVTRHTSHVTRHTSPC
jgi:hypothetical protein